MLVAARRSDEVTSMADLFFVAVTLVFFGLSWLYVRACERL
jgi:hypothetical protein